MDNNLVGLADDIYYTAVGLSPSTDRKRRRENDEIIQT